MTPLRFAWLQLTRRRLPAILATALVAISCACVLVMQAWGVGAAAAFHDVDPGVDVLIGGKSSPVALLQGVMRDRIGPVEVLGGETALEQLRTEARPRHLMRWARLGDAGDHPVIGVDDAWFLRPTGVAAPTVSAGRLAAGADEAVVGARTGLSVGDVLPLHATGPIGAAAFADQPPVRVVGILSPFYGLADRAVFVPITTAESIFRRGMAAQEIRPESGPLQTHYLVTLPEDATATRNVLYETFHVRRAEQVIELRPALDRMQAWTGATKLLGTVVGFLLLVLAMGWILVLATTRAQALRQLLGLLDALGWRHRELLAATLYEHTAIVVVGWAIGATAAWGIVNRVASAAPGGILPVLAPQDVVLVLAVLVVALFAIVLLTRVHGSPRLQAAARKGL